MPTNKLLGLFDSLLGMQPVPEEVPADRCGHGSSMAGRWNLCSSSWRQRTPFRSKTSAWSSLRRKCRLQLMLLTFEIINKCRNRRKSLWRGGFGFSAIGSDLFREEGLHHQYGSILWAFGRACCRIAQLWFKFPCASVADGFSQML